MTKKLLGVLLGTFLCTASAQSGPVDHYTTADLSRDLAKLKTAAAATGSASETLEHYNNHFTMLAYRSTNGAAELHQQLADFFYVVHGSATLVTGGTIPDSTLASPGELRGKAVVGGASTSLGVGDVVHIPAGTPHQLLIAPGQEFLYFVVKVKEQD
jgi:mannose-6-phosphate isomerase-like protein (cupin superfamily)